MGKKVLYNGLWFLGCYPYHDWFEKNWSSIITSTKLQIRNSKFKDYMTNNNYPFLQNNLSIIKSQIKVNWNRTQGFTENAKHKYLKINKNQ